MHDKIYRNRYHAFLEENKGKEFKFTKLIQVSFYFYKKGNFPVYL